MSIKVHHRCPRCGRATQTTLETGQGLRLELCARCRWEVSPLRGALTLCGADALAGALTLGLEDEEVGT